MKLANTMLFLFAIAVGFSLVVLAQMSNGQRLYISSRVLDDYRITIEGEKIEMGNLQSQIADTQVRIDEYLALEAANEDLNSKLKEQIYADLAFFQIATGSIDVVGPGIEIIIDDGTRDLEFWENPNDILVHDTDLLLIINELKNSGAEAIAVNGQRIASVSSISCSGYTVRINGQFYARPFIIKAIGDGSRMSAALIGPGGYGTLLKEWGLVFKINQKDDILIPRYEDDRYFRYMSKAVPKEIKEGENN